MYPFLLLILLGALASTFLLYQDSIPQPNVSDLSQPGNDTLQPRHSVPSDPEIPHGGGGNDSEPSGCRFLVEGFGPLPEEDTPEAFREFRVLQDISMRAVEPNGYILAVKDADGSIELGAGYLGLKFLEEYNTTQCAELCDDRPTCGSFNIFINRGETRAGFEVVIAGSNLYNDEKGVLQVDGFVGPLAVDNNAAFDVPLEPIGGYDTMLSRDVFEYNSSFRSYDASLCASICNQWTQRNSESSESDRGPFLDGAFAACSMFVAFELRRGNKPVAMVCDSFSSVWSSHYQTLHGVDDLLVIKVSAFQREDYAYPAICALEEYCEGDEYYPGGDCSG